MGAKAKNMNLTEGTIWKQIVLFAFPLMCSNLFQQLYNTADSMVVGRFVGSTALAAVGSTGSVTGLLVAFSIGMGTGSGVVISQYYGAKDHENLHKAVHTAMALAIALGIGLGILGVILSPTLLRWMGTPEDVMDQAVLYLRINFSGLVSMIVYNLGAGILRAVGDSKRPLYYLVIAGVTNVILNVIFVVFFHMGVAGVSVATICSQVLSSFLVLRNLTKAAGPYRLNFKDVRFHKEIFFKIAKIGFPASIQSMVISLSNIVIQSKINAFGSAAMAGHSAASRVDAFVYMPMNAISLATTTFVGQNLGARKLDRVRKGARTAVMLAIGVTIVLGGLASLAADPIIKMFADEKDVIDYGMMSLQIRCSTYFLFAMTDVLGGVIRGSGNAVVPMCISLTNMCVVRIIWLMIATNIWNDFSIVVITYPMTWALASLCYLLYYWKGGWMKKWEQEHSS